MSFSIAIILPVRQADYLVNTVLDGFLCLEKIQKELEIKVTDQYPSPFDLSTHILSEDDFVAYAKEADLILLVWGKHATNYALAERINKWDKTIFIDGSECGKDHRYNPTLLKRLATDGYQGAGGIDLVGKRCALYFKRERPYTPGIIPLPFGIESRYVAYTLDAPLVKDIDFVCIFGQDQYPIMRRYATEMLKDFCRRGGFTCETKQTDGFTFDDATKQAGRNEFSKLLARAKVGISIGGGGFDTARFWEILGNNCLLLTEKIALYEPGSKALDYQRIFQFENLVEFKEQLTIIGRLLKTNYNESNLALEYQRVLHDHTSVARVWTIIDHARTAGILK
ncbi:MAG: hypothetical protein AAB447_02125 [Patescibacteria group bacterium]